MTFRALPNTGKNGLAGYNKIGNAGTALTMTCTTLQMELDRMNIDHVDYMSLDIEGAELQALRGVDFGRARIDVITVEKNDDEGGRAVVRHLEDNGYVKVHEVWLDAVFIHKDATEKMAWFKEWESEAAAHGYKEWGK